MAIDVADSTPAPGELDADVQQSNTHSKTYQQAAAMHATAAPFTPSGASSYSGGLLNQALTMTIDVADSTPALGELDADAQQSNTHSKTYQQAAAMHATAAPFTPSGASSYSGGLLNQALTMAIDVADSTPALGELDADAQQSNVLLCNTQNIVTASDLYAFHVTPGLTADLEDMGVSEDLHYQAGVTAQMLWSFLDDDDQRFWLEEMKKFRIGDTQPLNRSTYRDYCDSRRFLQDLRNTSSGHDADSSWSFLDDDDQRFWLEHRKKFRTGDIQPLNRSTYRDYCDGRHVLQDTRNTSSGHEADSSTTPFRPLRPETLASNSQDLQRKESTVMSHRKARLPNKAENMDALRRNPQRNTNRVPSVALKLVKNFKSTLQETALASISPVPQRKKSTATVSRDFVSRRIDDWGVRTSGA